MSDVSAGQTAACWTVADLLERFGPIGFDRVRHDPAPGTATEQDLISIHLSEDRLYELVDRTLVEKTVGTYESYLAGLLVQILGSFVRNNNLGIVLPPDGMLRIAPGLVRIPDVSFISWDRLPNRRIPESAIADIIPDLAIEVISPGNTSTEMERKLQEYFSAGIQLVWYVQSKTREIHVYETPDEFHVLSEQDTVDGGNVVPGFVMGLGEFFSAPGGK
jgi:Uma2 family endonuclease